MKNIVSIECSTKQLKGVENLGCSLFKTLENGKKSLSAATNATLLAPKVVENAHPNADINL